MPSSQNDCHLFQTDGILEVWLHAVKKTFIEISNWNNRWFSMKAKANISETLNWWLKQNIPKVEGVQKLEKIFYVNQSHVKKGQKFVKVYEQKKDKNM